MKYPQSFNLFTQEGVFIMRKVFFDQVIT